MEEKSREAILAERKLRKAAKLSKKKISEKKPNESQSVHTTELDCYSARVNFCSVNDDKLEGPSVLVKTMSDSFSDKLSLQQRTDSVEPQSLSKKDAFEPENRSSATCQKTDEKSSDVDPNYAKSKSQLRAERRAKQEAQRAQKVQKKTEEKAPEKSEKLSQKMNAKPKEKATIKISKPGDSHKIKLFTHLYRNASLEERKILADISSDIHKAIIRLGVQYKNKVIIGSNARVVALLNALKQVISDHQTPAEKDFSRSFEVILVEIMMYLNNCRLCSVSMTNAVKYLKSHLSQLPNNITDHEAQIKLREAIDEYMKEQIDKAGEAICYMVRKKISQDDVILTFGYSSLIERILVESHQVGIKFRVIIVDAGPLFEGKELLRRLVKNTLKCTYVLLSAASYIMKEP